MRQIVITSSLMLLPIAINSWSYQKEVPTTAKLRPDWTFVQLIRRGTAQCSLILGSEVCNRNLIISNVRIVTYYYKSGKGQNKGEKRINSQLKFSYGHFWGNCMDHLFVYFWKCIFVIKFSTFNIKFQIIVWPADNTICQFQRKGKKVVSFDSKLFHQIMNDNKIEAYKNRVITFVQAAKL